MIDNNFDERRLRTKNYNQKQPRTALCGDTTIEHTSEYHRQ